MEYSIPASCDSQPGSAQNANLSFFVCQSEAPTNAVTEAGKASEANNNLPRGTENKGSYMPPAKCGGKK